MGYLFADQYSLLHFSVGSIAYFWNIPFAIALVVHFIFEMLENTKLGMRLINRYIIHKGYFSWPGGKNKADKSLNILGDNFFFALGWIISAALDVLGIKYKWYI